MTDQVLVTGASGFIAKHVLAQLLADGFQVRGTVRSLKRRPEIEAAIARAGSGCAGSGLELVEADLTRDEGWQGAAEGCRYVLHMASPFPPAEPRDPETLIRPAREGTRRVLQAAAAGGVERVVVTSSIIAVMHADKPDHVPRTEMDWSSPSDEEMSTYGRSKTLAERTAWEIIDGLRESGSGHVPELVAINPGVVFGPALDKDLSTSHVLLKMMGRGSYPLLPRVAFPTVDVRDVAAMHVRAMTHERAAGERFICADETLTLRQIGEALVEALPDLKRKVPTRHLPSGLVRFAARFDRNLRSIRGDLDKANLCDTSKARNELGLTFRPAREAVSSAALSLRELGVI